MVIFMKFYIIGIKGTGLSAMACLLSDLGFKVKGCDVTRYIFTQEKLIKKGIEFEDIYNMNYQEYDYIILGNTFWKQSLLEQLKKENKIVLTYQEMLSYFASHYQSIAICGTHGKTTTSHMIQTTLNSFHSCSYLIGDGEGKGTIDSQYFIFEACEYEDNFLNYRPDIIVLTNIDFDHVDYFKNQKQYNQSFLAFLNQSKDFILINQDDSQTSTLKNELKVPYFTYGIEKDSDVQAKNVFFDEHGVTFDIRFHHQWYNHLHLPLFGKHLFYDALATIALNLILKEDLKETIFALSHFTPAHRRFNIKELKNNVLIDDYGHHPSEIKNTILSIKQKYPHKILNLIFHPDRYSRIAFFFEQYIEIFKNIPKVYIIPFINMKENSEEENILNQFLNYPNIHLLNDEVFQNQYENTVILLTGSKDMNYIIQPLIKILS